MREAPIKAPHRYVTETDDGLIITAPGGLWKRDPLSLKWNDAQHSGLILEKKPGSQRKVTGAEVEGNTIYVTTEPVTRGRFSFLNAASSEMLCYKDGAEARAAYDQLRTACPKISL